MDLVSDALFDGRRLRALRVVDAFTREALAIDVDQGIEREQVVASMAGIASVRGAPKTIRADNGPEFISKALDRWAYENGVTLDFSRPGQAHRQRLRRELQWTPARRMPEQPLFPVVGRREPRSRLGAALITKAALTRLLAG